MYYVWEFHKGNDGLRHRQNILERRGNMKIKVAFLVFMLCIATTASAFARGGYYGGHGGGYYRGGGHYDGYRSRSYYGHGGRYYGHGGRYYGHGGHHYDDGLGIAVGVMGGLLLGSALTYSAAPPPPTVVYGAPYTVYQPQVVVQQPRVCVEERRVSGEWQISQFDGRRVWVEFAYPVTQRIQVPCY